MGAVWLPDLPDVIAAAGIPVKTWPGWETRCNSKGGYTAIYGIAVHHTASNATATNDMTYMWNIAPLRPVGAIYLARDGSVTVGAAGQTNCQGLGGPLATSKGVIPLDQGNRYAIAIEAANTGIGEVWPQAQQDTYVRLCAALVAAYGLQPSDVFAHHEWAPTRKIDPFGPSRWGQRSWDMDLFRADVAAALAPPTPDPVPPTPTPTPNEDTMQLIQPHGDIAVLIQSGLECTWAASGDVAAALIAAKIVAPEVSVIQRIGLKGLVLVGPAPTAAAYAGAPPDRPGRTSPSDFAGHRPNG